MTRISLQTVAAVTGGLLALAAPLSGFAQQSAAERYARTLKEAEVTTRYNAYIEQQLRSQQQEIATLEAAIIELDQTATDVQPLLQRMFDELAAFVDGDVPFFEEERDRRIATLRDLMARVDASPSEKFRRLIEAYQIEMEYGRTLTSYKQSIDGSEAEMVRLGRVALLYRKIDSGETGYWDRDQRAWVAAPELTSEIEEALAMAKEEKAPDLIFVPVPAAQGGRS